MVSHSNVLLTGATGFLGSALLGHLSKPILVGRAEPKDLNGQFFSREMATDTDFSGCVENVDVIIHCAARAHIMNDYTEDPLAEYREVNVAGTLKLARQAAAAGVKRFIFISSIKVNGESTTGRLPFTELDALAPLDPYGISKMEAEIGLQKIASETKMDVVIIRPPLVYGAGVKANFLNLLKLASKGLMLPFGSVHNRRSMIYLENLVDFILRCIDHPAAANQIFLISDGEDVSLMYLLKSMGTSFKNRLYLLSVPVILFKVAGVLLGKRNLVDRLVGDLQVDSGKAMALLNWKPPYTLDEGISITVNVFLKGGK